MPARGRFSPSGRTVFVFGEYYGMPVLDPITVVDIETGDVLTFEDLGGVSPRIDFTADERKICVKNADRNLAKIDLTDGTVTEIPLRFDPGKIAANADGTRLIMTGPLGRDLYVMDTRTDRLIAQIQLPLPQSDP